MIGYYYLQYIAHWKYVPSSVTVHTKYYICRQRNKDYVSNALSRDCRNDASSSTDSWIFNSTFCQNSDSFYYLKLRHYEKATKFEKISHLFWQNSCFYSVASKQVGCFFKFLCPCQKSWTLKKEILHIQWLYISIISYETNEF